jgi:hypothetical protein
MQQNTTGEIRARQGVLESEEFLPNKSIQFINLKYESRFQQKCKSCCIFTTSGDFSAVDAALKGAGGELGCPN